MKVILEIEYPNDKIFKADTLPIRIVDLNYGIYFDGKAKIVHAIPVEWINSYTTGLIFSDDYEDNADSIDDYIYCIKEMVRDWEKEK